MQATAATTTSAKARASCTGAAPGAPTWCAAHAPPTRARAASKPSPPASQRTRDPGSAPGHAS
eukprot:361182-Chlamydomonas_euryale.AAC.2